MKTGLYARLAFGSIRRNGRLYLPYFITCILMVANFYIMHFIGYSGMMKGVPGGSTATTMVKLGTWIIALFGVIFLFYTQSTLLKNRKKEFGMFSILGMNGRNLGRIIFFDTLITWAIALAPGLAVGIGLSKLAELGFAKMIAVKPDYSFHISGGSVGITVVLFTGIFLLLYLNSLRHIRFSTAIELVRSEQAGEKPPKGNWFLGILGLVFLATGYWLSLKIRQPMAALMYFFVAVTLVIIGTYLTLISGSVLLCGLLKKRKNYYYQTKHFVSVSSMAYRMKRNGAGLASICILLTMVLVMLSSTSALFFNADECLTVKYPNEIGAFACKYGYVPGLGELSKTLEKKLFALAAENGAKILNNRTYSVFSISGYFENSTLQVSLNSKTNMAFIDYDRVAQVLFLDVDEYNRVFGYNETVLPGEALVGCSKDLSIGDVITVGELSFKVAGRIDENIPKIDPAVVCAVSPGVYMIVNDAEEIATHFTQYKDYDGEPMLAWFWYCNFDTGLDEKSQIALAKKLEACLKDTLKGLRFDNVFCSSHEGERGDFVTTFGGLLFLAVMLSIVFLVSCVVIMYYKQVSEGFEDKARFGIMQKVGMTDEDIKKSIDSQMLTVFLVPIGLACLHTLVVLPIVNKLLVLFGLFNVWSLLKTAGICALVLALFYTAVYRLTSRAYYKIVR